MNNSTISYLTAKQSLEIDEELMSSSQGFSLEQLMENAGISVSHAAVDFLNKQSNNQRRVLILCGPGNNGGDGLVAARHLSHFGYAVTVVYPKQLPTSDVNKQQQLYFNLLLQCKNLEIPVLSDMPGDADFVDSSFDLILDAIFGFSFKGESLRSPFDTVINVMKQCKTCPIMAVDIPSGWHVENGNIHHLGPDRVAALISLTAPKLCARNFEGVHYLGGRFVPPAMSKKWNLNLPAYSGIDTIVQLN